MVTPDVLRPDLPSRDTPHRPGNGTDGAVLCSRSTARGPQSPRAQRCLSLQTGQHARAIAAIQFLLTQEV
jgi:hypothetical protein